MSDVNIIYARTISWGQKSVRCEASTLEAAWEKAEIAAKEMGWKPRHRRIDATDLWFIAGILVGLLIGVGR
tara:strand:- start:564 stop:776 length:213 start_codon:yes stop_codon:yes gene_type:complete